MPKGYIMKQSEFFAAVENRLADEERERRSHADVERAIRATFDVIKEAMVNGDDVHIGGFGVFCTRNTKERQGRNPSTGEPITIPASRVVRLSVSDGFKKEVAAK